MIEEPQWSIGIEEEYLLVEQETGELTKKQPPELFQEIVKLDHGLVNKELLSSQIEIGTNVCCNIEDLRSDIELFRTTVKEIADKYGLAPIAASSHPFAEWHEQQVTEIERYQIVAQDLQQVARQQLVSGLHVHLGIEDLELRIDLMGQITYFLPHLLALSTSSPFWEGRDTGLKSYRTSMLSALPRSGLPEKLNSWNDFKHQVDVLVQAEIIEDASKVWWTIRPSERYPTLEMRITDLPTRIDDTITIASLYLCLMRMLWRLRMNNQCWRDYSNFLLSENIWRAQRYGVNGQLIDFGKESLIPFPDLVEEMIELVMPDAEALDCVKEVEHARTICRQGTSADRQLAVYYQALETGATDDEAIKSVVDALIDDTIR